MKHKQKIEVKTFCLLVRDGRTLVANFKDAITGEPFFRPLGGSLEFNETSEKAIQRETREELKFGVRNLMLLEVVENCFSLQS